ncbi:MAG: hypothetical protein KKG10_14805 [Proteobacteria bacterium]|nr:hypothetical protein [Pseudomonadota bacterium]
MGRDTKRIQKQSFVRRFVFPAGMMLLIWLVLYGAHQSLWQMVPPEVHRRLAWVSGMGSLLLIGFGPLIAWPVAYFRGAVFWERVIAGLMPGLAWWFRELYTASGVFSPGETIYYAFGSAFWVPFFVAFAMMGLAELICRARARRKGIVLRVWTPLPVAAILACPVAVFSMAVWGGGVHWFYIYQEGYKALFR